MPDEIDYTSKELEQQDAPGDIELLKSELSGLISIVTELESKVDDLYMRPRMPFTQNAAPGDILELDGNLIPQWIDPGV